jgi:YbbR domain-containing protein
MKILIALLFISFNANAQKKKTEKKKPKTDTVVVNNGIKMRMRYDETWKVVTMTKEDTVFMEKIWGKENF